MNRTVTIDELNITVDIKDSFGQIEMMSLAASAPKELAAAADDAECEEDFEFEMTAEVIRYFEKVLKTATELDDDTIDELSWEEIANLASEVLNVIFQETDADNSRRIRRVRATKDCIEALFRGEMAVVAGMPDDATMEDFHYDPSRDELQFVFSSDEWPEIDEGAKIPLVQAHVIQLSGDV